LDRARGTPFVIGGSEIYKQALPRLRRLHLTLIHRHFEGDAFFPEIDLESDFLLEEESEIFEDPFPFQFQNWIHRSCLH
jgi:dihydrofolate reductase